MLVFSSPMMVTVVALARRCVANVHGEGLEAVVRDTGIDVDVLVVVDERVGIDEAKALMSTNLVENGRLGVVAVRRGVQGWFQSGEELVVSRDDRVGRPILVARATQFLAGATDGHAANGGDRRDLRRAGLGERLLQVVDWLRVSERADDIDAAAGGVAAGDGGEVADEDAEHGQ